MFTVAATPWVFRMMSTGPECRPRGTACPRRAGSPDHALVAVPAGELVAVRDLSASGHVERGPARYDARASSSVVIAGEHPNAETCRSPPSGTLRLGVADLAGLLTEDRAQPAALGVSSVSPSA